MSRKREYRMFMRRTSWLHTYWNASCSLQNRGWYYGVQRWSLQKWGMCDFELKCLHLAFVSSQMGISDKQELWKVMVMCILSPHRAQRSASYLAFSKPDPRWQIALKIGPYLNGPCRSRTGLLCFVACHMTLHCHGDLFCMCRMIDWVFWKAQWQLALKQCHDISEGFTLLIPGRATKTACACRIAVRWISTCVHSGASVDDWTWH